MACRHSTLLSAPCSRGVSLCPCVHTAVFDKGISHMGSRARPSQHDLIRTHHIYNRPISKSGHLLRFWILGLHSVSGEGTTKPTAGYRDAKMVLFPPQILPCSREVCMQPCEGAGHRVQGAGSAVSTLQWGTPLPKGNGVGRRSKAFVT